MNSENRKATEPHKPDKIDLINMLLHQILACTSHGKNLNGHIHFCKF